MGGESSRYMSRAEAGLWGRDNVYICGGAVGENAHGFCISTGRCSDGDGDVAVRNRESRTSLAISAPVLSIESWVASEARKSRRRDIRAMKTRPACILTPLCVIEDFAMCGSIESRANCLIDRVLIDSRPAAFNASSFVKDSEYYRAPRFLRADILSQFCTRIIILYYCNR